MSPRRNRQRQPGGARRSKAGGGSSADELAPGGPERVEEGDDGDWVVRPVSAAGATKLYRCPGCDQEIPPGTAHVVAWPADWPGADDRRHWHTACWRARGRRPPRVQRSRGAPRY